MGYLNESGEPEGFIIDLINRVAEENQLAIQWQYGEFPTLMEAIKLGAIDILPGLGYTEERAQRLIYSQESFANVWGQVFLPTNSKVETILDLQDKTIGLLKNGINGQNFLKQCHEYEVTCHPTYADSYNDVFELLKNAKVDAVVANNVYGLAMAKKYPFFASNIMFDPFKVYITQNRDRDKTFLSAFDRNIVAWKQDPNSYYYQSRQKWLDSSPKNQLPQWFYFAMISVLFIALGSLITAIIFHRKFRKSTAIILAQQKQLRQIINHMPHLIFVHDYRGDVVLLNHSAAEFLGLPLVDEQPLNIYQFVTNRPQYKDLIEHSAASNNIHHEIKIENNQKEIRELMVSKTLLSNNPSKNDLMLTVAVDVTEISQFENKIKYLVQHDELTGLANINLIREHLQNGLQECAEKSCNGALLIIDIDQFKTLNDAQGHRFGDVVLKTVSKRLSNLIRVNDLVGRLSSDVFILHLSNLNADVTLAEQKALEFAHLVCDRVCEPILFAHKTYHVTACVGLSIYPRDGERVTTLLQRADTALYEAKNRGRSRVRVFHKEMEDAVKERHALETDIHQALKNNDIKMLYQPILTFDSNLHHGWEALARWQHPQRGLLLPDTFIPIIEQTSMMREFGYWVIEQVCQKIQSHKKQTPNDAFYISANLSMSQLKDRHFIDNISQLINRYDITPGSLEFEITESILMYESKQASEMLNQLKLMGIRIAIDDFGTGYSSFTHLKQLPIDKIKIDRSFIEDIPNNDGHAAMIQSIIAMARAMGLLIVAEGVETQDQYQFLKSLHCDYYQGFYFAKPTEQLIIGTQP
ncbi:EAL domain-containing protein [Marinicella gelatinilytica]|uniref:EAL domain-containing protein n=1 Tax=Marinicella gelatinilytica TaxID=2996017 RepID=UPI0022608529|nr:EAL domain-containing protein [Marinicella gelatinilytica]MCX7543762.1 EAL domain-containing protein [Marinicella gelatinilytica]